MDCEGLDNPLNGQVILSGTEFGSFATYKCDAGLNLVGNVERLCQENGEWSGADPVCTVQRLCIQTAATRNSIFCCNNQLL